MEQGVTTSGFIIALSLLGFTFRKPVPAALRETIVSAMSIFFIQSFLSFYGYPTIVTLPLLVLTTMSYYASEQDVNKDYTLEKQLALFFSVSFVCIVLARNLLPLTLSLTVLSAAITGFLTMSMMSQVVEDEMRKGLWEVVTLILAGHVVAVFHEGFHTRIEMLGALAFSAILLEKTIIIGLF